MNIRFLAQTLAIVSLALSAAAAERVYTQTGGDRGRISFPADAGWSLDGGGFEPGDDVTYRVAANQADFAHYVNVTNAHTTFGAIATTNLDVTLEFADWTTGAGEINLSDLSGWAGLLWFFRSDLVNFAQSTTIRRLRASGRARLNVPAGRTVVVSNLVGRGTVRSVGAGELELVRTSGDLAALHFDKGDLTLHGDTGEAAKVDVAAVLRRAMIHLDAQNTASLTCDANGRVSVWRDPVGGGQAVQMTKSPQAPYQSYIDIPLPTYVADYAGSGLPVVDFGPYRMTNDADFATSGASSLKFMKGSRDLRDNASHVFLVFADTDENCCGTPFNDSYNTIFKRAHPSEGVRCNYDQTKLSVRGALATYGPSARTGRDGAYNGYPVPSMFQFGGRRLKIAEMDYRRTDNSAPTREKRVGALARYGHEYWGGVAIGEIIVFSDDGEQKVSLTDAERAAINDYLRRKWLPDGEHRTIALNELFCGADSGAVRVPEGGVARVRHCLSETGRLVKDGAGTLLVGDLTSRARPPVVEVRDGAFGFASRHAVSSAAPASGPRHHFDADAPADSVETETRDGVQYVTAWRDQDPRHEAAVPVTDLQVTSQQPDLIGRPTLVDNMLGGRRGISFGPGRSLPEIQGGQAGNSSALVYRTLRAPGNRLGNDGDFREGFAVVRFRDTYRCYVFGTDTFCQNMYNMGNYDKYAHPDAQGASVAWNGEPFDLQNGFVRRTGEFAVVRFSCGDVQPVNAIALDRYTPGNIGGVDVCEYIVYDRILTDRERLDTEAYLMRKWLDRPHPLQGEPCVSEVRFAAGKTAHLVAESAATVADIVVPGGALTKSGDGPLTVGVRSSELAGRTVTVAAGSLAIQVAGLAKAAFHVDASDASTLVTNAAGQVTRWNDVRGADVFHAENWADWPGAKPTVAARDCNGLDTVDFGTTCIADGDAMGWPNPEAKAACAAVTAGSGLRWKQSLNLVEGYQVFRLNEGASKPPLVGGLNTCNFHPHDTYLISQKTVNINTNLVGNTRMWVDDTTFGPYEGRDETKWATHRPTERYCLYGFAVTNRVAGSSYPIGAAFAYERHQRAGGLRLAEGLYFTEPLTAEEREAVMAYLRHKWQAHGTGVVLSPSSVEIAKDASLACEGVSLSAGAYSFEIDATGAVRNALTVDGTLTLGSPTTLVLRAPEGFALPPGVDRLSRTLISATRIAPGGGIVLDVDETIRRSAVVRVVRRETSIDVTLARRGFVLIVR